MLREGWDEAIEFGSQTKFLDLPVIKVDYKTRSVSYNGILVVKAQHFVHETKPFLQRNMYLIA